MNRHIGNLAIVGWIVGCVVTMSWTRSAEAQMIVAHRGASAEAPENTLASFTLAWQRGADAVEGDFYLTRDGQIVTIHDKTTGRTANRDISVPNSTLAELKQLDFGSWKSSQYRGERIPTLGEVLAVVRAGKKIFIEVKCGPEIVPRLRQVLAESGLDSQQTVVIAFDQNVIAAVKKHLPRIKAFWLVGYRRDKKTGIWSPSPRQVLATLKSIKADGLDTQDNRRIVNEAFVEKLRAANMEFHVWTVDDATAARYYQRLGVDSITTNRPREMRAVLGKGAARELQK